MRDKDPLFVRAYEVLHRCALFEAIDPDLLRKMILECEGVSWEKSEMLDHELSQRYLHIVVQGRLKIMQIDPGTGRSITLFILQEGDVHDLFTLLDGQEHIVFPVALDHVQALRISLERARAWIVEHPELNKAFLPYLGKRMRELEAFGESVVFHDTAKRLADLILRHVVPQKRDDEAHYPVHLIHDLSHEALAEMIGSVRSVVSAQIHKLKEEQIIISRRGHLAVKNLQKLIQKCDAVDHYLSDHFKRKEK